MPVILEHEHYGSSVARDAWKDGSLLIRSVEEYHASYMSDPLVAARVSRKEPQDDRRDQPASRLPDPASRSNVAQAN